MIKKILHLLLFFCVTISLFGQDTIKPKQKFVLGGDGVYLRDSTWKVSAYVGVLVSQTALYQWGPGGNNNFAFLVGASGLANYKKGKIIWDNSLDIKWGMVANGMIRRAALARQNFQKNIDVLALKSSLGYEIKKDLYLSARLGFESQFTPSYDYSQTDTSNGSFRKYTVSRFAAPAILTIGPGLTWKPKEYFTLFFSPAGGKMTFVTKDRDRRDTTTLSDGRYTDNYYRDVDETRFGLKAGSGFMGELGAELDLLFQKDIIKNVNWKSHLNVYVTYMNAQYNTALPKYYSGEDSLGVVTISETTKHIPVVKWDNDLVFKVNKFLSATLSARFVYQYNAQVPIDTRINRDGSKGPDGITDIDKFGKTINAFNKIQIFEQFGVGLSLKF
jgi:hypothetical protein